MIRTLLFSVLGCLSLGAVMNLQAADTRLYELRIYHVAPGKMDALHARFRDHTRALFEKHGIVNVGYWTPMDNEDKRLIYIVSFPDRAAHDASWKAFGADPEWQKVYKASEADGTLVTKVESTLMTATDFSPHRARRRRRAPGVRTPNLHHPSRQARRSPSPLPRLHRRPVQKTWHDQLRILDSVEGARRELGHTLIYILAHKSHEAGLDAFKSFRADPDGSRPKPLPRPMATLTVTDGVKSTYMNPTDYSPSR